MPTLQLFLYLAAIALAYLFRLSYLGWFGQYLLAAVIFVPILLLLVWLVLYGPLVLVRRRKAETGQERRDA